MAESPYLGHWPASWVLSLLPLRRFSYPSVVLLSSSSSRNSSAPTPTAQDLPIFSEEGTVVVEMVPGDGKKKSG